MLRCVQQHAGELIRFARRFSWCADDAQDAYQRALERLVRQLRDEPPEHLLPWLRTVIRHEAWSVREQRARDVAGFEVDFDREIAAVADPADRVAGFERVARTAEALGRLKPQEVTALVLRGEGLTYRQIAARTGWTYTKVNRCVTEGRRALMGRLAEIESGVECDRWLPVLSALADGEASAAQLAELRPHLRTCSACRATVRELHDAPRRVAALVPVALLPVGLAAGARAVGVGAGAAAAASVASGGADPEQPVRLVHHVHSALHGLLERATMTATRAQSAIDALSGPKLAAVAASTAAIAGGGAAIHEVAHVGLGAHHHGKPAQVASAASPAGAPTGAATSAAAAIPPNTAAAGSGVVTGAGGGSAGPGSSSSAPGGATQLAEFGFEPAAWSLDPSAHTATANAAATGEFTRAPSTSAATAGSGRAPAAGGEFASGSGSASADPAPTASASTRRATTAPTRAAPTTGRVAQFGTTSSRAGASPDDASGVSRSGARSSSSATGGGASSASTSGAGSSSVSVPVFSPPSSRAASPAPPVDRSAAGAAPAAEFAGP